jgi:hypothetical protein
MGFSFLSRPRLVLGRKRNGAWVGFPRWSASYLPEKTVTRAIDACSLRADRSSDSRTLSFRGIAPYGTPSAMDAEPDAYSPFATDPDGYEVEFVERT